MHHPARAGDVGGRRQRPRPTEAQARQRHVTERPGHQARQLVGVEQARLAHQRRAVAGEPSRGPASWATTPGTGARPGALAVCSAAITRARSARARPVVPATVPTRPVATNSGEACLARICLRRRGVDGRRGHQAPQHPRQQSGRLCWCAPVATTGTLTGPVGARTHCTTIRSPSRSGCRLASSAAEMRAACAVASGLSPARLAHLGRHRQGRAAPGVEAPHRGPRHGGPQRAEHDLGERGGTARWCTTPSLVATVSRTSARTTNGRCQRRARIPVQAVRNAATSAGARPWGSRSA